MVTHAIKEHPEQTYAAPHSVGESGAQRLGANSGKAVHIGRGALAVAVATLMAAIVGCGGGSNSSSTPLIRIATPSPSPSPLGLWVANRGANGGAESVVEFTGTTLSSPGASVPTPPLTNSSASLNGPLGLTFDSSNNQWVVNRAANPANIAEFKFSTLQNLAANPAPTPDVTISDDGIGTLLSAPQLITFESGNLWVANFASGNNTNRGFVTEYLANQLASSGTPSPTVTEADPEFLGPDGIAFDSAGNLFIADFSAGEVFVFTASKVSGWSGGVTDSSDAQLSDSTSLNPTSAAFDQSGNLWVADCEGETPGAGELYMFPKSSLTTTTPTATTVFTPVGVTTPNGTDQSLNCPGSIAFDQNGNLWYSNYLSSDGAGGSVGEFLKSQLTATGTSSPPPNIYLEGDTGATVFNTPEGIAFGPAL